MNRFVNYYKNEASSKFDCFVGFFHHSVMTMSVFMHVYRYPLWNMSVHYFTYSTHCIEAIVHSITAENIGLLFLLVN